MHVVMSEPAPTLPLTLFSAPVAQWFASALGQPTPAQELGWPPIARGESTLLLAPTGSGKTLAAFLVAIDRLLRTPPEPGFARSTRVLYVSPLKALAVDIERNLRAPLSGIAEHAARRQVKLYAPTVDVRTGDTPAKERARMRRTPGDILITTPESLYLLLTSAARDALRSVETIIVDEIHSLVPTKRGAHLALSLERLEGLRPFGSPPLQRIGLSATQKPLDQAARWLGGFRGATARPVSIVDAGARKALDLRVESVGERQGVWPSLHARVVELIKEHRSTIVFVNSRRLAERLAAALNDVAGDEIALAHHGSLAREKREGVEARLKRGELRAIVATSSLELGIDMGTVDLVVQIEAPPSVSSGLQRIGRACHGVGGLPRGVLVPKHRHDLIACAASTASMRTGDVEDTFYPRNPLDVLSQQIVAMAAMDTVDADHLFACVRSAAPFVELPRTAFDAVLDMLSGRYPSDEFAELRPRITWDRVRGRIEGRVGAHRLAVTNGGTIPDRGLYGVFVVSKDSGQSSDASRRVGELDEEMVYELREGEVFLLGASSWRAEKITSDRVVVSAAAGEAGKMPFWHGDRPGRTRAFGARIGELIGRVANGQAGVADLVQTHSLETAAARTFVHYVGEQVDATGEVPTDRVIVVERFVDEVGDWRVVVMCPMGTRVLAPWAIAVAARLRQTYVDVDLHYTDDGMAFRIPACEAPPAQEMFFPAADEIESMVTRALNGTALFAARFRECATRALLLPRRDPRRRTPLWAQRKRSADLLAVASKHPTFPIVLEAYRECMRDAFDLSGLVQLLRDVAARRVRATTVDTRAPSPFAASILFAFVANFIYEADAPVAERRAQALTVDPERLRELLGDTELRQLLDANVIIEHVRMLQRTSRPARHADAVHDMLLAIGDLSADELRERASPPDCAASWSEQLLDAHRAIALPVAGETRLVAVEDAAKFRDALGVTLPQPLPAALLAPTQQPARDLIARYARTHGPFAAQDVARRLGLDVDTVERLANVMVAEGRLVRGAFLPNATSDELCDRDVLDAIRRKSLAKLRRAVEPVDARSLARFLPHWQGLSQKRRGRDALLAVMSELRGCPLVASALESELLPARLEPYNPADLDALCSSGQVVWTGIERLGQNDGRIAFYPVEDETLLARPATLVPGSSAEAIRNVLGRRGAVFFADIARDVGGFPADVLDALWEMVWAGEVTNDTIEPLRSRMRPAPRSNSRRHIRAPRGALPGTEGRWSLRASRGSAGPDHAAHETDRRMALARALLDRYGVVTREAAHAEDVVGGFAAVYELLKELENKGRVRRGYFVEGRGGAQFAVPGADDRLRAGRDESDAGAVIILAATDPANAWGALLEWPQGFGDSRPQRAAGARVLLRDGALLGWLGRGEHPLLTFLSDEPGARATQAQALATALGSLVDGKRRRALLISTVDGNEASQSPLVPHFVRAGFVATRQGLLKRIADVQEPLPTAP
jgi:ATP-dependent Lhr-like helicase